MAVPFAEPAAVGSVPGRESSGVPAIWPEAPLNNLPAAAATAAGYTRLRAVLMTAGAMIFGMIPMALGLGEGGEQNAPLARAVIGGLTFATFATLVFVPTMYGLLRGRAAQPAPGPIEGEPHAIT